ncbi:hypothetical protein ACFL0G_00960 [Candidatus Zixiibacteriota bacterium]
MEKNEKVDTGKGQDHVVFWGGENKDKQDYSMDWSHDGQFWLALSPDRLDEILTVIRQLLSEKFGGEWPERPSPKATGQFVAVRHNHHLFATFGRKEPKERYAEIHPTDTGRTIFVRLWQGLTEEAKAAFQARGFEYHPQIPDKYKVKVPGTEITAEKAATLEKFRKSHPLTVPDGKLLGGRSGGASWKGILAVVVVILIAAVLLRGQLGELFVKKEPVDLGSFQLAQGQTAVYEKSDGRIIYALTDTTIEQLITDRTVLYGELIDTLRADFYGLQEITDAMGTPLYKAKEGAIFTIPSYLQGTALDPYTAVDAEAFHHDKKKDWEDLQGQKASLKGFVIKTADGFYLEAGDGSIKLVSQDPFMLLNLNLALKKRYQVTVYGTVGETFDWKTVRKDTQKMFSFSVDPVNYATMIAVQ